jgi:hypothetical protein
MLSGILRRFALLHFFSLVVSGFPSFHLDTLRIYGGLQRIAVFFCSPLYCSWSQNASSLDYAIYRGGRRLLGASTLRS